MNLVSPEAVAHSKNLQFAFSGTLRNESVDLNQYLSEASYVMDINGDIYQGQSASDDQASIVIIGGDDRFIGEKADRLASNFFYTEPQKIALYKMIKELALNSPNANITCDSDKLEQVLNALLKNYSR